MTRTLSLYITLKIESTGGWRHLNWGGWAWGNGWREMGGMVSEMSNAWFPYVGCHSIHSVPAIIMTRLPLSSFHWLSHQDNHTVYWPLTDFSSQCMCYCPRRAFVCMWTYHSTRCIWGGDGAAGRPSDRSDTSWPGGPRSNPQNSLIPWLSSGVNSHSDSLNDRWGNQGQFMGILV
jgi:hypothetical protein